MIDKPRCFWRPNRKHTATTHIMNWARGLPRPKWQANYLMN